MTERPFAGSADLQALADLLNSCEAVDCQGEGASVSELQHVFDAPKVDKARDFRFWEDEDGELSGFGQLCILKSGEEIDCFLWFRVHPAFRGKGLETQILTWALLRTPEISCERGFPVKLHVTAREDQAELMALLKDYGFTIERYSLRMARILTERMSVPHFPEGFTLNHLQGQRDAAAWVELYNQTFVNHWNHHDSSVWAVEHRLISPNYHPELDLITIAPDGTFAAFCYCSIYLEGNVSGRQNEGWIVYLGTRPGFRHLGLGRAMLLAGLQRLKAFSMDTALLGVDFENSTGAMHLYESVGFRKLKKHTQISYAKVW